MGGCHSKKTKVSPEITPNVVVPHYPSVFNLEPIAEVNNDEMELGVPLENIPFFEPIITSGRICKIVDGDTYHVISRLDNFPDSPEFRFKIRLYGVDCWESRTKNLEEKKRGLEAKKAVTARLLGQEVRITYPEKNRDKYGRLLANIFIKNGVEETNLSEWIIKNGHGHYYNGGKKEVYTSP